MSKFYFRFSKNRKVLYALIIIVLWCVGYLMYFRYFGSLPQATAILFQEIKSPQSTDIILVFSPHEDDETLGVGGYIAQAQINGAKVSVVFATDGNRRYKKETRLEESLNATATLGVPSENVYYYDYPDMKLSQYSNQLKNSIDQSLNSLHPNIVFTTSPNDIHPDHKELGLKVKDAIKRRNNVQLYNYLIHYRAFPRPQAYRPSEKLLPPVKLINTNTTWYKFSLSTLSFDRKNEAVFQYKSQLATPFLRSLMTAFIRQNEIFAVEN